MYYGMRARFLNNWGRFTNLPQIKYIKVKKQQGICKKLENEISER